MRRNFKIVCKVGRISFVFKVVNCVDLREVVAENSLLSSVKLVELGSIFEGDLLNLFVLVSQRALNCNQAKA